MIADYQKSDQLFGRAHIVNTCRFRIHDQLLSNLSESISKERVNDVKVVFYHPFFVIPVTAFTFGNSILVHNTVSKVAERVIQNDWGSNIFWLCNLASSPSVKSLDSILLKMRALGCCLKIGHGSNFDLRSLIDFVRWAH